jgi:magnesium transporter
LVDEQIAYGETAIFVGEGHLITVRHGSARAHTELRHQLEASPTLLAKGSDYVLHAVLDFVVDGYLPIIQALEDEVLDIERRTLEAFLSHDEVKRLFHLRRDLIRFKRVLSPMSEVCGRLEHLDTPCLDDDVRPYFRDVLDHTQKVEGMVDALREVITSVFEAASLLEQQRQGAITRKLAAWAAILAVPTAVAGIYGMNFEHMPELKWTWGYPAVMAGIAAIIGWLYSPRPAPGAGSGRPRRRRAGTPAPRRHGRRRPGGWRDRGRRLRRGRRVRRSVQTQGPRSARTSLARPA